MPTLKVKDDGAWTEIATVGASGKTAYQYAVEGGYTGTEAAFSEKLKKEYLPLDGTTPMAGTLSMGGNKITGLGTPTSDADAATKKYILDLFNGGIVTTGSGTRNSTYTNTNSGIYYTKFGTVVIVNYWIDLRSTISTKWKTYQLGTGLPAADSDGYYGFLIYPEDGSMYRTSVTTSGALEFWVGASLPSYVTMTGSIIYNSVN